MSDEAADKLILALLVVDGFVTLVLAVLFLPAYVGAQPFPVSAIVAGVANVCLVLLARNVTDRLFLLSLPVVSWVLGFILCMSNGPGGDAVLLVEWRTLLLLVGGLAPPAALLYKLAQNPAVR